MDYSRRLESAYPNVTINTIRLGIAELRGEAMKAVDSPKLQPEQKRMLKKAMGDCFQAADEMLLFLDKLYLLHRDWPVQHSFSVDWHRISKEVYVVGQNLCNYDVIGDRSSIMFWANTLMTGPSCRVECNMNGLISAFANCEKRFRTLTERMQNAIEDFLKERKMLLEEKNLD